MDNLVSVEKFKEVWEEANRSSNRATPLIFSRQTEPVYGIWNGRGWMETTSGYVFQSWSPNGLKAVMLRWSERDRNELQICEIGPDGLPVPEDK